MGYTTFLFINEKDLESFTATSTVRYKIANLAFAEMLKGTEVKNIVTATG